MKIETSKMPVWTVTPSNDKGVIDAAYEIYVAFWKTGDGTNPTPIKLLFDEKVHPNLFSMLKEWGLPVHKGAFASRYEMDWGTTTRGLMPIESGETVKASSIRVVPTKRRPGK